MQAHVNDVTINEVTKVFAPNLTNDTHSIIIKDPDDPAQRVILNLDICGETTYFPTWPIKKEERESGSYPRLELKNEYLE